MLFNSYQFIFLFIPFTLCGFFAIGKKDRRAAIAWLTAASLLFFAYWDFRYLPLLASSVIANFLAARMILRSRGERQAEIILAAALGFNLLLLGYFKYANFFVTTADDLLGLGYTLNKIILPVGISFFTFTQIGYLIDCRRHGGAEYSFLNYVLFVTYFPHLIAGPILHHREMMPQFADSRIHVPSAAAFAAGITIFVIGLAKKVVLADGISQYVGPVFDVQRTVPIGFLEAWGAALAYTLQLYFDFSGYSDMAIGVSALFGIALPLNFYSPYKSSSIIEFWRRWHITLSRFLRDYLYIPLGGSRRGRARRYLNLVVTMLLGGLWHGAGWTFLVWGGLHALYLCVAHGWRGVIGLRLPRIVGVAFTFTAVVFAWVYFRAPSVGVATSIVKAMLGRNGVVLRESWLIILGPVGSFLEGVGVAGGNVGSFMGAAQIAWIFALLGIIWLLPNTHQIMNRFDRAIPIAYFRDPAMVHIRWQPNVYWAAAIATVAVIALNGITRVSEFIYYQF